MDWFVQTQKLLPKKLITIAVGCLASNKWPPLKNLLIDQFIKAYKVDMKEAKALSSSQYVDFNDFFTRSLKLGARTISNEEHSVTSPADGAISEFGSINEGKLLQAKGIKYSVKSLVVDEVLAEKLDGGTFATIYLSPKDYHRVHMPITAEPAQVTYVPGKLFSVNQRTAENLDSLFSVNERLVVRFEDAGQPFVVVLVGAMIVGGMASVLTGDIKRSKTIENLNFTKDILNKGDELGRFYLGSTAIILFPKEMNIKFESALEVGNTVKMGQKIAMKGGA